MIRVLLVENMDNLILRKKMSKLKVTNFRTEGALHVLLYKNKIA